MSIEEIRAKQQALLVDAHNVRNETVDGLPDERVAELEARFDTIMLQHDALEARAERESRLEAAQSAAETRAAARRPIWSNIETTGALTGATAEDNFRAYLRGEVRAQTVGTTTQGGFTVPQGFLPELIRSMLAWGPMTDATLVREIATDTGNPLPVTTTNDTANIGVLLAEATAATSEGDVVFGQKQLDAYKYSSGPIQVSSELLSDSAFDINAMLFDMMAQRLARKINLDLTLANGSAKPNGVMNATTLGKTAALATAITADELIDLYHSVDPAYREAPTCVFMFRDATLANIRKLKDGENRYLIDGLRDGAGVINLAGISVPYRINQAMPAMTTGLKSIAYGDFKKFAVRRVKDIVVKRSDEFAFTTDVSTFIGLARYDSELLDTAAIKHLIQA